MKVTYVAEGKTKRELKVDCENTYNIAMNLYKKIKFVEMKKDIENLRVEMIFEVEQ